MKYFISFDFEGLAGVTNWQETYDNQRFNELATEQVNAFLKGIFETEPKAEVVICDSHSYGCNLIWEKLFGNTKLIKGYPRRFYMIEGLNESFDSLVLFGYHAPVGTAGNMDHTYSSSSFYSIKINGKTVSEACINSLIASHYNVPLQFVFADDVTANWLHRNVSKKITVLESKKAISRFAAENEAYSKVLEKLFLSGTKFSSFSKFLYPRSPEYTCEIQMIDTNITYACSIIPGIKMLNDRTIEFTVNDELIMYRYLMTVIMAAGSVKDLYR